MFTLSCSNMTAKNTQYVHTYSAIAYLFINIIIHICRHMMTGTHTYMQHINKYCIFIVSSSGLKSCQNCVICVY